MVGVGQVWNSTRWDGVEIRIVSGQRRTLRISACGNKCAARCCRAALAVQLAKMAGAMLPYLSYHLRPSGPPPWPPTPAPYTVVFRTPKPQALHLPFPYAPVVFAAAVR